MPCVAAVRPARPAPAAAPTSSAEVGSSSTSSFGPQHDRARDGDAAALAAGEFVRIAFQHLRDALRLAQAHFIEHLQYQGVALVRRQLGPPVQAQAPRRRSAPPSCAGSARRRGPEHHLHAPAHAAQRSTVGVVDALAVEAHFAAGHVLQPAAPCPRWSCPTPTRRRCPASRRA